MVSNLLVAEDPEKQSPLVIIETFRRLQEVYEELTIECRQVRGRHVVDRSCNFVVEQCM